MKRTKKLNKLLILFGVLVVLCVVTLIAIHTNEKKEQIQAMGESILAINSENVTALSWEDEDTSLSFHKEDNTWSWDDDASFPVDNDAISDLLSIFEDFRAAFVIEDPDSLSDYGLSKPTATISFTAGSQEYTVLVGTLSTMDSQRYVSIGDGNVYLLESDPMDTFSAELSDTILNDSIPYFSSVSELKFSGSVNSTVTYDENSSASYDDSDVYFTTKGGKTASLDTSSVKTYLNSLMNAGLTNYVTYNATSADLDAYGLSSPTLTITVSYTDSSNASGTVTISLGQNPDELAAKEQAEANGEEYDGTVTTYARVGDSSIIYQLTEEKAATLLAASYNDLRHQEVLTTDFTNITQMDISLDGTLYSLTSDLESSADERTYFIGEEEVDTTDIQSSISALSVTEFSDETPTGKEEISLVLHIDNEEFPELKIEIYRYDGTNCLVVVNDQTMGLVSRSSVVDLVEAVNAIVLA